MEEGKKGKREQGSRGAENEIRNPKSEIRNPISILQSPFSIFCIIGLLILMLGSAGCRVFTVEPTPTPTIPMLVSPPAQPTMPLILPTPPPGPTLTAMVEAYRRTRTPAIFRRPTETPIPTQIQEPTATPSPTLVSGPSIYAVPELTAPGEPVEVRGTGWQPEEEVAIGIGTAIENARLTDTKGIVRPNGTFATTLKVPSDWASDNMIVVAQSADGRRRAVTRLYLVRPTETVLPTPTPTETAPPSPSPTEAVLPSPSPTETVLPLPSPSPLLPTATPTLSIRYWRGEYYDNPYFAGDPVRIRDDRIIDFNWEQGAPAPDVPADNFSVRWTRQIDFLSGGYQFDVQVDDGVRVFINDQQVLDEWKVTSTTSYNFQQMLDGPTEIRVEYFDAGGNATIRFQWRYLGRFPDWRGAYYDNRSLAGTPAVVRNDPAVDFNWGDGSPVPQIPPDDFSVRWTRNLSFDAGTHRFHAQADDGIRLWVDGRRLIDEWHISSGETDYTADLYLPTGWHDVRIEYYEAGGKAEVSVWWENLDAYPYWRGAYFDNRFLSGQPALVRNDNDIDFDWGNGGPNGVGPDNFSAHWTDRRSFAKTGVYRFSAEHDDGVRLWVDDKLLIDEWYETGPITHHTYSELSASEHAIKVEYFEASGDARIRVWWELKPIR